MNLVTMTEREIQQHEKRVRYAAYDLLAHTVWRNYELHQLPPLVYIAYMHRARRRIGAIRGSRRSNTMRGPR